MFDENLFCNKLSIHCLYEFCFKLSRSLCIIIEPGSPATDYYVVLHILNT